MQYQVLRPLDLGTGVVQPGEIVSDEGWAERRAQQMVAQRLITPAAPFASGDPVPSVGRQTTTKRRAAMNALEERGR